MGIGKALAYGVLGGAIGGAEGQLETLRNEAKEAKEMRMASFKLEAAERLQTMKDMSADERAVDKFDREQGSLIVGMLDGKPVTRLEQSKMEQGIADSVIPIAKYNQAIAISTAKQKEVDKLDAADSKSRQLMGRKADMMLEGFKAKSPSGELSVAETVSVDAVRAGVDPKIFERVVAKIDPRDREEAFIILRDTKGFSDKSPAEQAIEGRDLAEILSGLGPDASTQFVKHMKAAADGTLNMDIIEKAVEDKKLTQEEADKLVQFLPEEEERAGVMKSDFFDLEIPRARGGPPVDTAGFESSGKGVGGVLTGLGKRFKELRTQ